MNGQPLPASGQVIAQGFPDPELVVGGRLVIVANGEGFPTWEYCTEDDGHRTFADEEIRYLAPNTDEEPAELMAIRPLATPRDTLTLAADMLTWQYNLGADGTDLLRFRRIGEGEFPGTPCNFLP